MKLRTSHALVASVALLLVSAVRLRASILVPLPDNHPAAAAEIAPEGAAPAARVLRMQLYLTPRNPADLDRLLAAQQDPASPQYQRWLSAAEYEARFGPSAEDVAHVARWLTARGLTVTSARAGNERVAFEGPVAAVQRTLHVRIAGTGDGRYFANVADPLLPASLTARVSYLGGLHNLSASVMDTVIADPINNSGLTTAHFGPTDVRTYSDEGPLLDAGFDGRGQCIAALEGSDVDQASLTDFNTVFGLPPFVSGQNYDTVYPDGPTGVESPGSQGTPAYAEALADIEYAHGIAPGAEIVLYAGNHGGLGTQGLVDGLKAATTDDRCAVITISWAQCGEPKSFYRMLDGYYKRGAAQGQSIFVATGDVGVAAPTLFDRRTGGCQSPKRPDIEENAGSPNVTAIGATQVLTPQYDDAGNDTGVGVPAEEVWDFDFAHILRAASTGGVSKIFPKPKFQKTVKGVKFAKRGVPDICLGGGGTSRPGYWECLDVGLYRNGVAAGATCSVGGGTSIAAPQWAAVIAIAAQKKGARFGNINPRLYAMAKANLANLAAVGIRDVTQGNNGYYPLKGYDARTGFDLASGWGSIDIAQFVTSFVAFAPTK